MNKRLLKRVFPLIAISLLASWSVDYAHGSAAVGQQAIQIEVAEAAAVPSLTAYGGAIGGVTHGDLFYIDATHSPSDIRATLYITNTQELIHYYRYLTLKVGIYTQSDAGEWRQGVTSNGEPIPDTFITLRNGQASLTLPGYTRYKLTIISGSFYCFAANSSEASISPQFYLEVE